MQAHALTCLGHALVGLGDLDGAGEAYAQSYDLRRALHQRNYAVEALAGLARVSYARGDLEQASTHVARILSYLHRHSLDGTVEPFRIYMTCYQILQAHGDPRAEHILSQAHRQLQERVSKIGDGTLRRSFLESVPAHREVINAYQLAGHL
jgi:hypothetical protein